MHISTIYKVFKECSGVSTDTRTIQKRDMFFALKGPNFNGNKYAEKALELGAHFVIVDEPLANENAILVDDVLTTLQELAKYHRSKLNMPVISITGSNGKTTTKELMHVVLATKYKVFATIGNYNNHIGVPLSLLSITQDHEMAIIELGANHVGEIADLCEIAQPNYGLVTNIGTAHIEGFGSQENILKAKTELFDFIRKSNGEALFVNVKHPALLKAADGVRTVGFGEGATFLGGKVKEGSLFCELTLTTEEDGMEVSSQLIGNYNAANIMAAAAVGRFFDVSLSQTKEAIETYQPKNNRSQWVKKDGNSFIMDAYNANPSSMAAAINNLAAIDHPADKKGLILGHMLELGDTSFQEHSELINAAMMFHPLILVGQEFEFFKDDFQWFVNSMELKIWFKKQNFKDYLFLVKGSRGARLERLLE